MKCAALIRLLCRVSKRRLLEMLIELTTDALRCMAELSH
jgi:hypothetical protein